MIYINIELSEFVIFNFEAIKQYKNKLNWNYFDDGMFTILKSYCKQFFKKKYILFSFL